MSDHLHPTAATDFFDGFRTTAPDGAYLSLYRDGLSLEIGVLLPRGKRLARQLRCVALNPTTLEEWEWAPREAFAFGARFGRRLGEALESGADFVLDP